ASNSSTPRAPLSHAGDGARRYDVAILGGGASGLAAAISAARAGARAAIIESDVEPGLGLLATGNGRCNISNSKLAARKFLHEDAAR
ncbi:NAD(P)/FAD-dependent oxidoreductase, partial [Acinetobacter sp. 163]|nr:NAD(P)/FAD-dependent oxidoreductase [Acinetobacter sp. 163]